MYRWRAFESIWERLVRAVEEGRKLPSKSLKRSELRRTANLTFSKTGLKLPTEKQWLRLSLGTIEYATNTYKKYFYTFRINQITFTYGERKKNGLTFTECSVKICRFLLLSLPYWKMKLPQCNIIFSNISPASSAERVAVIFFIVDSITRSNLSRNSHLGSTAYLRYTSPKHH